MRVPLRRPPPALVAAVLLGPGASSLAAQVRGTIQGRVVDAATQAPLVSVRVRIPGSELGATTRADGRYTLTNVPPGPVTVVAERIGYQRSQRTTTVTAGQPADLGFAMEAVSLSLDEVVVTATGAERRRAVGNAIATIDADVTAEAPINTTAELLTGRAAGVQVLPSSGTTGMGSRIRIRGANSVSLSNEPILFVDGVRVSNENRAVSYETGGDAPSRLNDLNPDEIASIEVVKGPAAATLYGTDAANGVLWITTKRGTSGQARWNGYAEQGALVDPYRYPASYRGLAANDSTPCRLFDVAAQTCTQARISSLNPLEDPRLTPLRTGSLQNGGMNVSGGREALRYFLSGDLRQEDGVLPVNALNRVNVRGNFDTQISRTLSATVSTGYLASRLRLPLNGNYELGILGNGLASAGTTSILGGWGFFPNEQLLTVDSRQNVRRFTGSVRLNWVPLSFLNNRLTVGLDDVNRQDNQFFPTGRAPAWLGYNLGAIFDNRFQNSTYTVDAVSTADRRLSPAVTSQTSVGAQYIRDLLTGSLATGRQLVAGSRSLAGAAVTQSTGQTIENIKAGVFVQEQVAFRDRLFLTGALRADNASAFGRNYNAVLYPKLSGSWVLSEEGFFPRVAALNSLRLRTAWGSSGLQPGSIDALRYYNPVSVTTGGASVTGVTFGSLGNPNLRPERSTELETGFDAQLLDRRLSLELTYYTKRTRDALILRQLPPSLGVSQSVFENLGAVRNAGLEALVVAKLVDRRPVNWELTLNGATNRNKLLVLGQNIPPIVFAGGTQQHVVGYPLGGYWGVPILGYADADGNGILSPSEIRLGTAPVYLGTPFSTRQLAIRNSVGLFGWVRLAALLDYRGGQKLYNNTEAWRNGQNITRPLNVPGTPLDQQARAVASAFLGTDAGYIEDASFWKLRELSITFTAPERYTRRVGSRQVSLALMGRNLRTWTKYSGIDPEVNQVGQDNFVTRDFMGQAPIRYWAARLNLGF